MAASRNHQLKVFQGPTPASSPERAPAEADDESRLLELCSAFGRGTGWKLWHVPGPVDTVATGVNKQDKSDRILEWSAPVDPGGGTAPGHLRIGLDHSTGSGTPSGGHPHDRAAGLREPCDAPAAQSLAEGLASLWNELASVRRQLRQREAELAVAATTFPGRADGAQLAERLEAVIRGGAEAVTCQAAEFYLLNESTTLLNRRASWGMPAERQTQGDRELETATGDLEALVGHAVTLENDLLFDLWNVPHRDYGAAVCVPVSSPTSIHGTLWMYSSKPRAFHRIETNLIEIIAGRLAVELERELLLAERRLGAR